MKSHHKATKGKKIYFVLRVLGVFVVRYSEM